MTVNFYVDKTAGKLAKWLRLMGFDTLCELDLPAPQPRDLAGRIRVTRNSRFRPGHDRDGRSIRVRSDHWFDQLSQIVDALGIEKESIRPFSRCLRCNAKLTPIDRHRVAGNVPDYVWEMHQQFKTCGRCGRIYWPGSHLHRSMETFDRLFSHENDTADRFSTKPDRSREPAKSSTGG